MVLAPMVALGAALRWTRWPRFALGLAPSRRRRGDRRRALNGERDRLSDRELAFVGIFPPRPLDGWRQADGLPVRASASENDSADGSAFDAAVLQAMRALGMSQERLKFLG